MVYKKLKSQLKQKIENLKDNPQNILMKNYNEKESAGRPYVNAVQIKIVSIIPIHSYFSIAFERDLR